MALRRRHIVGAGFGEGDTRMDLGVKRIPKLEEKLVTGRGHDRAVKGDAMDDQHISIAGLGGNAHLVNVMLYLTDIPGKRRGRDSGSGLLERAANEIDLPLRARLELLDK